MNRKDTIIKLFVVFFKIGLFTFGGGYAMLPLMHREAVDKYNWIDDNEMLDILAIAESTPGAVAINTATFVGYKMAGLWGSFFATFGVCLPSFIIISLISFFYTQFRSNEWVSYAFRGINAAVGCIVLNNVIKLAKKLFKKDSVNIVFSVAVIMVAFILVAAVRISAVYVIILGAAAGITFGIMSEKKNKTGGTEI